MRSARLLVIAILCLTTAGCSLGANGAQISGRWAADFTASDGHSPSQAHAVMTIRDDGTWTATEQIQRVAKPVVHSGKWWRLRNGNLEFSANSFGLAVDRRLEGDRLVSASGTGAAWTRLHWWQH